MSGSKASSPGTWLADLCAQEGMPLVLGHALSMKAIPGGKAKHDRMDAHNIAVLLRGGRLPRAAVYPAAMRATRDRLRRRMHLMRTRAERLAHSHNTHSPDNLPEIGTKLADKANRVGVAERVLAPAVQQSLAVALALLGHGDRRLTALALSIGPTATAHDAQTCFRLRSRPGVGQLLALVLLYAIQAMPRLPRGPAVVSDGRLVKCAKASAGKRDGTSGKQRGTAYLTGAFSEAAVLVLRHHPAGQQHLARRVNKHGQGQALTVLAQQFARAGSDLCTRDTAFDLDKLLAGEWRGAREPAASLDAEGLSLAIACWGR